MKYIIFFILLNFLSDLNSQCIVDAGDDVFLCNDKYGEVTNKPVLNAKIISGTPPFKIKWTFSPNSSTSIFSNDSIFSPTINIYYGIKGNNAKLSIFIDVMDSNGFKCRDSIIGLLSQYGLLAVLTTRVIKLGDTLKISPLVGGGIGKLIYSWTPNYNISDSLVGEPKVWPRKTTTYYSTVTDSLGCKSSWNVSWTIYIDSTSSIKSFQKRVNPISNFHNPIKEYSIFEISNLNKIKNIEIFDFVGQIVYSTTSNENLEIGKIISTSGIYYLVLHFNNNNKQSIKIIRE